VLIVTIAYSMRYSFAVFYRAILNEFGWSRADTAAAFSVSLMVYGMSSPFVGSLVDRLGPKKVLLFGMVLLTLGLIGMSFVNSIWLMYALYGVVMALGINSLGYAVHDSYLPNWFVNKRGTAFGLLMAGSGGANVLNALYQRLLQTIPWRTMYLIMAGVTVAVVLPIITLIIRRTPQEMGLLPDGTAQSPSGDALRTARAKAASALIVDQEWAAKDWTLTQALKTPQLWLMFFAQLCISAALNLGSAHQAIYCQDIGLDASFAASVLGLIGVATIAGNLMSGVSDRLGREITFTAGSLGTIVSIYALMTASFDSSWLLYVYAIIWGIFFGASSPSLVSGLADLFSGRHFGAINGFFLMGFGIGGALGPWLGGYIYDVTSSYRIAFIFMMASMVTATALFWLAAPRRKRLVSGKVRRTY
jgi:sugar phosphate permease